MTKMVLFTYKGDKVCTTIKSGCSDDESGVCVNMPLSKCKI